MALLVEVTKDDQSEGASEPSGHDVVQEWIEAAVGVKEETRYKEEDVVVSEKFRSPELSWDDVDHDALGMERRVANEETDHHGYCRGREKWNRKKRESMEE